MKSVNLRTVSLTAALLQNWEHTQFWLFQSMWLTWKLKTDSTSFRHMEGGGLIRSKKKKKKSLKSVFLVQPLKDHFQLP